MLAAEPPVNAYELSVSMERSNTPYLPLTPTLRMNYDYGLAQLQEMFPEQSSDDLLFVLEHAMGDVPQATANMFARTAISPTKPKACHQLQRELSTRDSFANSADSSGSSVSGTPDLTSHRQASQPTAESIAKLPDFLQQLILSPADGNNKHVGQKVSSNTPRSGQDAACKVRQQIAQEYSQPDSTPQSSNPDLFWALSPDSPTAATDCTAPLFPDDDRPADAGQKLDSMKRVLEGVPALSDHILANTLREHQYNEAAAVTACIELVAMQGGDPDWSSESDVDGSSVTTDSYAEAESPLHTIKAVAKYWPPDDAEKLQDLDFDKKVRKLHKKFLHVPEAVVYHHLSAAQGNYDAAVSMLIDMDANSQTQEAEVRRREAEDSAFAQQLQDQMNSSVPSGKSAANVQSSWSRPSSSQASDLFEVKHPEMKRCLDELHSKYPSLAQDSLENLVLLANGSVNAASQMIEVQGITPSPAKTQTGPGPSRLQRESTMHSHAQWPSVTGEDMSPPPGLGYRPPKAVPFGRDKALHVARRTGHSDIYTDARKAFRQAQGKMHSCRQAFHNAQAAGDSAQQRHWASQLEYWQQQALQEKKAAHKTIFSKKNADVISQFQVDLHALHVDEALSSLAGQIKDLRRFKCTWMVEVITGKGLHSAGKDPKLLPAVKRFLRDRDLDCWDAPGKVVFRMEPRDEDYEDC